MGPNIAKKAAVVSGIVAALAVALLAFNYRLSSPLPWLPAGLLNPRCPSDDRPAAVDDRRYNAAEGTGEDDGPGTHDKLLGGLLSPDFDEASCRSRYEAARYRKPSPFRASPALIEKIRAYEVRHRRCGPGTEFYAAAMESLKSRRNPDSPECKYIGWLPQYGLGNRMLSLTSSFLYAMLTDRVLVVRTPEGVEDRVFCEPFPNSSWALSPDFPFYNNFSKYNEKSPESHVNVFEIPKGGALPPFVYYHLLCRGTMLPERSFCDEDHQLLDRFQWVLIKADSFFATNLFLMPMFTDELQRLFPEKQLVFHLLGRYLLHPVNKAWGIVTRYYDGYLAGADERIGIQARVFEWFKKDAIHTMTEGIKKCIEKNELLPRPIPADFHSSTAGPRRRAPGVKAVLIASLKTHFYDTLKAMYYDNATASGELVTVYQPTHEEAQHTESASHNHRSLAEIYLLSLCDKLVTTAWSTFGYVAHSLAGIRPLIIVKDDCIHGGSIDPCMLSVGTMKCSRTHIPDIGKHLPFVRYCEDIPYAIQLVD